MEKFRYREVLNDVFKLVYLICDLDVIRIGDDFFIKLYNYLICEI